MFINRTPFLDALDFATSRYPVTIIGGARQVGKTTLARSWAENRQKKQHWFDLERPSDLARLENPELTLGPLKGLVVLDEVQRKPDLFPLLRVLADRKEQFARFLLLGSASGDLLYQSSETLAGRVKTIELPGFLINEGEVDDMDRHLLQGGFPRSYLNDMEDSLDWREQFIQTFLEKDLAVLGVRTSASTLRRVWTMLAHYHGQVLNFSEIGRSLQVSDNTIRNYVEIFSDTYMLRILEPWHENLGKRLVKAPKLYFRDSGILNALLGIRDMAGLQSHPKLGAIWEGYAAEQIIQANEAQRHAYFWKTHAGAELDLLIFEGSRRIGFEFKYTDSPKSTRSMHVAYKDLKLDRLVVVHPGVNRFPLADHIEACPLRDALNNKG